MVKKFQKLLVVLLAVVLVAAFATIPVNACPLEGDYSDDVFPQPNGKWAYGAEAWAYCPDSPYWCYVDTTAGYDWAGGDPGMGGGTARANVYVSGFDSYAEAAANYMYSAGYGCHC